MIKVLQVMSSVGNPGGVQSLIWNYYKYFDSKEIQFDFAVFNNEFNGFEKNFLDRGSKIFYIPPKHENLRSHIAELDKVIKDGEYDIVHCHQDFLGFITMFLAWKNKVKVRIIHSHKANLSESIIGRIKRKVFTYLTCCFSNHLFACGIEAANWTYGKKKYKNGSVYILNNAIELSEYRYNQEKREQLRLKIGLDMNKVIGNVARFTYQKNHELLIDIFEELYAQDSSFRLLLVGDGEDYTKIKELVHTKKLDNEVLFVGNRSDIPDLLSVMDVFVLTSRFEGLPVTLVEAQSSGLFCVVSDVITTEINIKDRIEYLPLDCDRSIWCSAINDAAEKERYNDEVDLINAGFSIKDEAQRLCDYYKKTVGVKA